ncbi:MAG: ABC transporter permease [Geminicoccaceae bacterium]
MAERRTVLSVRGLHVYYGASHALQGVDMTLSEGVHAVLGRNGMGKTTLCHAIMGLVPVQSGSIKFEGRELAGLSPNRIAKLGLGYTPQGRRLWPSLTVDEHLRLCAVANSPWTVRRIYDTFPRLAERRTNGGGELSGGEQQMLAIARALLPGPRLLVMDEPTEGLAPVIVDQVEDMLREIGEEGDVSVLLVEQNVALATAVASEVSIMVNGRISTTLPPDQLAADRALQQRLLGVGRTEKSGPDVPPLPEPATDVQANEVGEAEDPMISLNDYIPPPRWSSDQWKMQMAGKSTMQPSTSSAPAAPALEGQVIVAGTFDTKGQELGFLRNRLVAQKVRVKTVDLSTSGKPSSADVPPHHIAAFHPGGVSAVMTGDRGTAVAAMAQAFEAWTRAATGIAGMISAAGSGGTALATPAMRVLPVGVPKVMISTVASGEVGQYVGPSDIMMMYSVTDVQGINRISAKVLANGADALAGAVRFGHQNPPTGLSDKPALGLTMFGVTTSAVQQIVAGLEDRYECLVFHATGVGGQSMEKLADSGMLSAALDVTTTEICDMMMGGVFPATEDRFGAFIRNRIPYLGSVGALDMVNWHAPDTVPERYQGRLFYEHNPQITLMRTTAEENTRMGTWIASRLNQMTGPVRFILPLGGVSALDAPGEAFHDPVADKALFDAIRATFKPGANRELIEINQNINDPAFAAGAIAAFSEIAGQGRG